MRDAIVTYAIAKLLNYHEAIPHANTGFPFLTSKAKQSKANINYADRTEADLQKEEKRCQEESPLQN
jgi:hypothetical protein